MLDHRAEIYIPSQCKHKEPLPERARNDLLIEAKKLFSGWFGGYQVSHRIGGWVLPDGTLAEEVVDIVISSCTIQGLQEHEEDLKHLAVRIADELDQDAAALGIDGRLSFYEQSNPQATCILRRKGAVAAAVALPVGRPAKTPLEKMQALYAALDSFSSLDSARHVFSELLDYDLTDDQLPCRDWPGELKAKLVGAPQVICYTRGFKIVHLHLKSDRLMRGWVREVVTRIHRDSAEAFYGLFVVSNEGQTSWELLNVTLADGDSNKRVFRRIPVGSGRGARTATERMSRVSLEGRGKLTALEIQKLHDAVFDVESVTKEFYRRIADWYFWALQRPDVKYPRNVKTDAEKSIFFIRMLTRVIFCWFMREKGLIPWELFERGTVDKLLKDATANAGTYYRTFLQNLFFATLNQEENKRKFRVKNDGGRDGNRGATSLYRYEDLLADPKALLELFREVPFVNGGLFDCLDEVYSEQEAKPDVRLDDFSEEKGSRLCIPNELFFGREREVDLTAVYGDKKHRREKVGGLIDILSRYQFTIEENTPLDQAVALDPELLGKVFENLLASYNEETKTTARKALGAFYTPREIVDYMVDESLIAHLKTKLEAAAPGVKDPEARLRKLFAYDGEAHDFSVTEVDALIAGVDGLKALDPAVGSGAFPMGILHKLVFILAKLDPRNERWKERQIARVREAMATAEKIEDAAPRESTLREMEQQIASIEDAFTRNELDYGRKLFLIENCIYGVDIQPIAVQIARMRFFISLMVDQRVDPSAPNQGVRPLPNLETKFVAANSLIAIEKKEQQGDLFTEDAGAHRKLKALREKLAVERTRYFRARTPESKRKCRENDAAIRTQMAEILRNAGLSATWSRQLANWDPYDQNASAGFFDPEWMFGIRDRFHAVIANPPYVGKNALKRSQPAFVEYARERFAVAKSRDFDLFGFFIERSIELLRPGATLGFIVPTGWYTGPGFGPLRRLVVLRTDPVAFVNLPYDMFEEAWVDTTVFLTRVRAEPLQWPRRESCRVTLKTFGKRCRLGAQNEFFMGTTEADIADWFKTGGDEFLTRSGQGALRLLEKLRGSTVPLKECADVQRGVTPFTLSPEPRHRSSRLAFSGTVRRYTLVHGPEAYIRFDDSLAEYKPARYFEGRRILLREMISRQLRLQACIADDDFVTNKSMQSVLAVRGGPTLDVLLGIINSQLLSWYFLQRSNVGHRDDFPKIVLKETRELPIPDLWQLTEQRQLAERIGDLVRGVLRVKKADPSADTSALEGEIDERVFDLYGMKTEEIAVVKEWASEVSAGKRARGKKPTGKPKK